MLQLIFAAATILQAAGLQDFAGSWIAQVKGETFARLELTIGTGGVQGRLLLASKIHVDANGEVDGLNPGDTSTASISDVALRDGVLSFSRKDGDDADRFGMRLADGRATLTFIVDAALRAELAREGIPVPRPITLTRVSP